MESIFLFIQYIFQFNIYLDFILFKEAFALLYVVFRSYV